MLSDADYISMYLIFSPDYSQIVSPATPRVQEPLKKDFYARQDILLGVVLYFLYDVTSHTYEHGE